MEKLYADSLFKFYKQGNSIGILISPLCHPEKDAEGKLTGKMECEEHSHTPDKLGEMLSGIKEVMTSHGFETHIFGSPQSMLKSLSKKLSPKTLTFEEALKFASACKYPSGPPKGEAEYPTEEQLETHLEIIRQKED